MKFYTNALEFGNNILVRGYDRGQAFSEKIPYKPKMFVPSKRANAEWRDIRGVSLDSMQFDSMREAKDFINRYEDVSNFKVYGLPRFIYAYLNEEYPEEVVYDRDLIKVAYIDIEVSSEFGFPSADEALHEVTAITLKKDSIFHVWGYGDYIPSRNDVFYHQCNNERELLTRFLSEWAEGGYPDVVTGWNVTFFDIPYLIRRMNQIIGESEAKRFSPWRIFKERQVRTKFKEETVFNIGGVATLDYLEMYQKFTYSQQESYKLDHIGFVELGERKLSYDYDTLHEFYVKDFQRFIDYNIRDVELVEKLEKQTGLLALALIIAYKGGVNYPDTLGTTAIWDSIIYRYLSQKNIAIPPATDKHRPEYPGGYVKDPQVGKHEWVVSFDLNSLYPMTIVQYNMSPETIVEGAHYGMPCDVDFYLKGIELPKEIRDMNVAVAANGVMFRKDKQGFLPEIIEGYYADRKATKKKMLGVKQKYEETHAEELKREMNQLDNTQQAIKILLNSLYGALGNKYFRYFDIRIAEGITLSGQLSIRWAEKYMNIAMNKIMNTTAIDYVIYMDTDSLYLNMAPLVKNVKPADPVAFLDKACAQKFEKVLEDAYAILFEQQNAFKNTMAMKREAIADAGIWTAKKRYILNVHNSEGVQYAEPKLKIMGIEAVKSSTPAVVRGKFKEAYKLMLSGSEKDLQKFVSDFYEVFKGLAPEDVSFPRGVSEIDKWEDKSTLFKKGVPIHVRGAIVYNHHVRKLKLRDDEIKNGNKVKFCYLKMPNALGTNVVAFPQFLPKEFGIHQYIDYDTQFDKTFKEPLKLVSDAINWELEHRNTLESFFG